MGKHKEKSKKHKKEKKHKDKKKGNRRHSSSSEDEWVEKPSRSLSEEDVVSLGKSQDSTTSLKAPEPKPQRSEIREDWMSLPNSFLTASNLDRRQAREEEKRSERERNKYNPGECSRELNPYWKDGGDGLPKFKRPSDEENRRNKHSESYRRSSSSNWRKKVESKEPPKKREASPLDNSSREVHTNDAEVESSPQEVLSDKQLNALAAKLVKAEIMGSPMVKQLKEQLEKARKLRETEGPKGEEVILTQTDSRGQVRPVKLQSDYSKASTSKHKKQKIETHQDGERVRYFADDDKYSLKQMFENEKFSTIEDQNSEFLKMAGKIRKNDDLDEVFADNIRHKESDSKIDSRQKDRAISEHQKVSKSLDNCRKCLQSDIMQKHLMISMNDTMYLSVPSHEPLTDGHCLIVPIRHAPCATQLDENEWADLMDVRRALTKMFQSKNEDVIFFETAMCLQKYPHMYLECVPVPKEEGDLAPIYFKKAIDESETEWAQNKKLVSMKNKDIRRAVPKGLPYFCVSFGLEEGFAHVIEDEKYFPSNFAQEIIGGILDLHHSKWRKPKQQSFEEQSNRVREFSKEWQPFDCTNSSL